MHERGRGKQGWKAEGKSKRVVDSWLTTTLETSSQLLGLPVALATLLDLQEANKCSGEDNSGKIIPSDVEGYVLLEEFGNGLLDLGRGSREELSPCCRGPLHCSSCNGSRAHLFEALPDCFAVAVCVHLHTLGFALFIPIGPEEGH